MVVTALINSSFSGIIFSFRNGRCVLFAWGYEETTSHSLLQKYLYIVVVVVGGGCFMNGRIGKLKRLPTKLTFLWPQLLLGYNLSSSDRMALRSQGRTWYSVFGWGEKLIKEVKLSGTEKKDWEVKKTKWNFPRRCTNRILAHYNPPKSPAQLLKNKIDRTMLLVFRLIALCTQLILTSPHRSMKSYMFTFFDDL